MDQTRSGPEARGNAPAGPGKLSVRDGISPTPYGIDRQAAKAEHAVMAPHTLPTGRRHAANAGRYPLQQHGHDCYETPAPAVHARLPDSPRRPPMLARIAFGEAEDGGAA